MTGLRLTAAAVLGCAAAGWGAPAHADPAVTVTFSGGCGLLGLGGSSMPDVLELEVPSGTNVGFHNALSRPAILRLDGQAVAEVAPDDTATVWFGSGQVSVAMEISCLVSQPSGAVTVAVLPAADPTPSAPPPDDDPVPDAPVGASEVPSPRAPAGPSVPAGGPSVPGGDAAAARPTAPDAPAPVAPPTPDDAAAAPVTTPSPTRATAPGSPTPATVDGGVTGTDRAAVDTSAGVVDPGLSSRSLTGAAKPTGDGSIGLLALIATVCVVGVSAGAVRAIIAQRANRTGWA